MVEIKQRTKKAKCNCDDYVTIGDVVKVVVMSLIIINLLAGSVVIWSKVNDWLEVQEHCYRAYHLNN